MTAPFSAGKAWASAQAPVRAALISGVMMLLLTLLLAGFVHGMGYRMQAQDAARRLSVLATMQAQALEAQASHQGQMLLAIAQMPEVQQVARQLGEDFGRLRLRGDPLEARAALSAYLKNDFAREFQRRNRSALSAAELQALLPGDDALAAQSLYIAQNRYPIGKKGDLLDAGDGSDYSRAHARAQALFRGLYERFGLYDVYLVDAVSGRVVYSYLKDLDFAASLEQGPWASSGLGEAFRHGLKQKAGQVWMSDWQSHRPALDDVSAFAAAPIHERGAVQAVLVARVPIERVNQLMSLSGRWKAAGLGLSGDTVLIGRDGRLRSASRAALTQAPEYLRDLAQTQGESVLERVRARDSDVGIALASPALLTAIELDGSGSGVFDLPHRAQVVAFVPVSLQGQLFHVLARIDAEEAMQGLWRLSGPVMGLGFLASLLTAALAWRWSQARVPVRELRARMGPRLVSQPDNLLPHPAAAHRGGLPEAVPPARPEAVVPVASISSLGMGEVAGATVLGLVSPLRGSRPGEPGDPARMPIAVELANALSDALSLLTGETGRVLHTVGLIAQELAQSSLALHGATAPPLSASSPSNTSTSTPAPELPLSAAAAGSLSAAAAGTGTGPAPGQSAAPMPETDEHQATLRRLAEQSMSITQVVNIIQGIAERTSVLALNALIHAAAAGEAGRSFALLANEVRRLSDSARESTRLIARLAAAIHGGVGDRLAVMRLASGQLADISALAEQVDRDMLRTRDEADRLSQRIRALARQAEATPGIRPSPDADKLIQDAGFETLRQMQSQASETKRLVDYAKTLLQEAQAHKLPD